MRICKYIGMQEEAIQAGLKYSTVYLPFMLESMEDICIRSTLMLLKKSWMTHLRENGMLQDMPRVIKILQWFPVTSATVRNNNTFKDEMDLICFDSLFEENSDDVLNMDVRTQAIVLFNKMWSSMMTFLSSPSPFYYQLSDKYFQMKMALLKDYANPKIQEEIRNSKGFAKEEKKWIEVVHWREIYIEKMQVYYREWTDDSKIEKALHHETFISGMKDAMTPPISFCETMERTNENQQELYVLQMVDNDLIGEDHLIKAERDRRERARQALSAIRLRWDRYSPYTPCQNAC